MLKNLNNPIENIKFSELERYEYGSYKSVCPKCGGLLVMSRDQKTFVLEDLDHCLLCGQVYRYTDINELRKLEGLSG